MSQLTEAKDKVKELSTKALAVAEDNTLPFADKKKQIDGLETEIKSFMDEIEQLDFVDATRKKFGELAGGPLEMAGEELAARAGLKSLGRQLIDSEQYKSLLTKGMNGKFTTGDIELKTTLTEGTVGTPGPGYQNANALPTLLPGIVDIKLRRLTIADLFPAGTTTTSLIRYLVETSITNAAGPVIEGDPKPESAIAFNKVDEVLAKIATFLPISDEMLEDWAQTMSYVDARLILFVLQAEETQLLSGDGTNGGLVGILNRSGLTAAVAKGNGLSAAGDNSMDAIYRQITQIRVTQFLEPSAIVIDPNGWQNILLAKATGTGNYFANGPFADAQNPALWSKPVAVTPAMSNNTALVGAFDTGGQIFRKGGLTVETSNSHADFFQRNLTAIRAEERLALAVYRPGAFGLVTGLT